MIVSFVTEALYGSVFQESKELASYELPVSLIENEELLVFPDEVIPNENLIADSFIDVITSTITYQNGITDKSQERINGFFLKRSGVFKDKDIFVRDGYPSEILTKNEVFSGGDNYFTLSYYGSGAEGWDGVTITIKLKDIDTGDYVGKAVMKLYISRWLASSYPRSDFYIYGSDGLEVMRSTGVKNIPMLLDIRDGKLGFIHEDSFYGNTLDISSTAMVFDAEVIIDHRGSWYGRGGAFRQKRKKIQA